MNKYELQDEMINSTKLLEKIANDSTNTELNEISRSFTKIAKIVTFGRLLQNSTLPLFDEDISEEVKNDLGFLYGQDFDIIDWRVVYKSDHYTGGSFVIIDQNYPRKSFEKISKDNEIYYICNVNGGAYHVKIEFVPLPHDDEQGMVIIHYNKKIFTQERLSMICDDYKENYLTNFHGAS